MERPLRYIDANGLRFAYFEEGQGPLVLLLHGFLDTPHTWDEVQSALAARGFRVVAPFLRGYPPTQAPADGDYSAERLGQDVLALIDAFGASKATVVGHDWGAFAAYAAANQGPDRIDRLVTLAIPHPAALRTTPRMLYKARHFLAFQLRKRALARLRRDDFAQVDEIYRRWSPRWQVTSAELLPVKRAFAVPGGLEGALGYYWSFARDAFSLRGARVRRMLRATTPVPTLSFFGETDGALDLGSLERTRRCFSGPYEMLRVPGAGHFLHREAPEVFLERTLRFLLPP